MCDKIKEIEIARVAHMGLKRNASRILEGNLKERTTGRPAHKWEDNIKTYLMEIG
jgi:hypothetical protein